MYATCIDTCSTLIYINYIHIQVRGGGGGGGGGGPDPPDPPPLRPPLSMSTALCRLTALCQLLYVERTMLYVERTMLYVDCTMLYVNCFVPRPTGPPSRLFHFH